MLVITNHEYTNIQMMGRGPKKQTYGGDALRHLTTGRIGLFNLGVIKDSQGSIVGNQVGVRVVKNKLESCANANTEICLIPGQGVSNVWSVYTGLKDRGLILVSGSWAALNIDGEALKFQGWSGLEKKCIEDPTLFPRLVNVYLQG
jgi:hypothetical protein